MAIVGFIVCVLLSLYVLIAGTLGVFGLAVLSGRSGFWVLIPITIGLAMLAATIYFAPFTLVIGV